MPLYQEQLETYRANPESPEPSDEEMSETSESESELDSEAEAERQFRTVRTGVVERPKVGFAHAFIFVFENCHVFFVAIFKITNQSWS